MDETDVRNLVTWSSDLVWLSASLGFRRMHWEPSPTRKIQNYMTWMNGITTESKVPNQKKKVADTATHSPTPPEALFWSPLTAQAPSHTPKRKCQQEDYMNRSSQLDYETEWRDMLLVLRWERIVAYRRRQPWRPWARRWWAPAPWARTVVRSRGSPPCSCLPKQTPQMIREQQVKRHG